MPPQDVGGEVKRVTHFFHRCPSMRRPLNDHLPVRGSARGGGASRRGGVTSRQRAATLAWDHAGALAVDPRAELCARIAERARVSALSTVGVRRTVEKVGWGVSVTHAELAIEAT